MAVVPAGLDVVAELGRNRDLVADGGERFSDELLARVWAVHLGGVEERDAPFMCRADDRDALAPVCGRSVVGADAHAPGAELRDLELPELARLHLAPSS